MVLSALAFTIFYNKTFFSNLADNYHFNTDNAIFLISTGIIVFLLTSAFVLLIAWRYTTKTTLMLLFPCAAMASYFMQSYNIVIDSTMIQNTLATDLREASDLLSVRLLVNLILWGILPSCVIYALNIHYGSLKREFLFKSVYFSFALMISIGLILLSSSHFATFFRENKHLRYYTNPLTFLYSAAVYIGENFHTNSSPEKQQIGLDALIPEADIGRKLVILVVGETARSDHFSLNGYNRETNPRLKQYDVISFNDVTSCATTTAISVPCMFSFNESENFDIDKADYSENLLDVLDHANVATLWRDNNSDSKGVAQMDNYQDFRNAEVNPVCDVECRDVGMLFGLDEYIENAEEQHIVIILHQMGNHGPSYFKRYPDSYEVFRPACRTNQLQDCNVDEITNAYDNAIFYTDYFLASVIDFLKNYDDRFETAMLYMSDHGESLGENSLYLHGLPNFMAPDEQRKIPAIIWLGEKYEASNANMLAKINVPLSHDYFFHTVLGLLELQTDIYDSKFDIVHGAI